MKGEREALLEGGFLKETEALCTGLAARRSSTSGRRANPPRQMERPSCKRAA